MLSTPFEFQIVFTPKPMHRTESTTLVLSLQKFPRTAVKTNRRPADHRRQLLLLRTVTSLSSCLPRHHRSKTHLSKGVAGSAGKDVPELKNTAKNAGATGAQSELPEPAEYR